MVTRNALRRFLMVICLSPVFFSFNLEASNKVVIKAKKIYTVSRSTMEEGMILIDALDYADKMEDYEKKLRAWEKGKQEESKPKPPKTDFKLKALIPVVRGEKPLIIGVDELFGSLEIGKAADIVFFDGDPLKDISRVTKVFIGGRMVVDDE